MPDEPTDPFDGWPPFTIERRRPYIKICMEVITLDMRNNTRLIIIALVAAVLLLLAPRLLPGLALAQPVNPTQPPLARVPIWPGSQPLDFQTQCGGNQLAAMVYWPQPSDTRYRADFMAQGGGIVYLSLPLGVEEAVTLPDTLDWSHQAITVTVPYPVGTGPIAPIYLMADVYCSPAVAVPLARAYHHYPAKPLPGNVTHPAHITYLNVYAIAQP